MKESSSVVASGGTGIPTTLLVVFIVLKLTGVTSWSWWWVFSPFWILLGVTLFFGAILLLLTYLADR